MAMIDLTRLNGDAPTGDIDEFGPGDTVTVNLKIIEGDRERIQAFQGNVISGHYYKDHIPAPTDTFTVRRLSYGVGVERIIPYWSPNLDSVKVTRHGSVRRSRLFFLRGRTGKRARIKERRRPTAARK
jgi:large subunit ribosomal protein L19